MKTKLAKLLIFVMACIAVGACSTSTKLAITGVPGTGIYTPSGTRLGVIPPDGTLQLNQPDEDYYGFFLAKPQGKDYAIPFALDYKHKGRGGTKFAKGVGVTFAGIGLAGFIGGLIAYAAKGDDGGSSVPLYLTIGGLGLGGLGASFGVPADSRMSQDSYAYEYQYLYNQRTNQDFQFTLPDIRYVGLEQSTSNVATSDAELPVQTVNHPIRPNRNTQPTQATSGSSTQRVNRPIANNAAKVVGSYTGTGGILVGDEEIEALQGITVQVVSAGNSQVDLNIIEANGNDLFGEATRFNVERSEGGKYLLKNTEIPDIQVVVFKDGLLMYTHPAIEIDGTIYTLRIAANKRLAL